MSYYNIALANEKLRQFKEAIANYEKFLHFWLGERRYVEIARKKIEALKKMP